MDELTIGDKIYISSKRAASITGYAKDYVGQLCREGYVEAKMVGRSWYVLESSIREHRFGKTDATRKLNGELNEKEAIATEALINATVGTWEAPKYVSEEAPKMPEFTQSVSNATLPEPPQTPEELLGGNESITEMQAAWKEWFENKEVLQEPRLESPEVIEAREEAEEQTVVPQEEPIIEEAAPIAVPITVHRIPIAPVVQRPPEAPVRPPVERVSTRHAIPRPSHKNARDGKNLVGVALMVVLAGIVIIIAVVGSGFGGNYLGSNAVTKYLGGTSSINK